MYGRRKPYTERGIKGVPCIRFSICGNMAHSSWTICADNNVHRPLCKSCDEELNEMVLRWVEFPDWQEKMQRYRNQ
jgi:hypothetical protein